MEDFESIYEESENFQPSDEERAPLYNQLTEPSSNQHPEELIAKGGMKTVSKIYCSRTQRYVAKATLNDNSNPDLKDAFIREARLTALLDHPNIIKVHDISLADNGEPYFTMELKTGSSLNHYHKERHNKSELLNIFIKICDAIAYAHSRRVLHLDLKPENVQVGSYGEVVVCDWGLGKILDQHNELLPEQQQHDQFNADILNHCTLYGETRGTPGFMAPEQVENREKSIQTDIYGLGAILFSLLAPLRLKGKSQSDLLEESKNGIPSDLYNKPFGIPNSLKAVIEKAMHSDPTCRYSSVNALREDIQLYLNEYPTEAQGAGFFVQVHFLWKRNLRVCQVISLSIIIMAVGLFFFMERLSQSEQRAINALKETKAYASDLEKTMLKNEDLEKSIQNMSQTIVGRIFSRNQQYRDYHLLSTPKVSIERSNQLLEPAYETQPNNGYIIDSLAANYFIAMDFTKLHQLFTKHPQELVYFTSFFKDTKPQSIPKDFSTFHRMVEHTNDQPSLMEIVIAYHAEQFREHSDFPKIISQLISIWSPRNSEVKLTLEEQCLSIDAPSLTNFKSDAIQKCLLRYLHFKELKIISSCLTNADEFEGLTIRKLDLRATKINDLEPLLKLPELDLIRIREGQVSQEQISTYTSKFRIKVDPVFEAEYSTFKNGAKIMKDHHDYTGEGFLAGFFRNNESISTFDIPFKSAENMYLTLKYSAGFGDAICEVIVNGKKRELHMPSTKSWKLWRTIELPIETVVGSNKISFKMKLSSQDCFNLDHISLSH